MQPKELFEKWMTMIPAKRMAATSELKGVSSWSCLLIRISLTDSN